MKKLVNEILFGKNSMLSGLFALAIISAVGLGCFCNKDKFGGLTNSGSGTPTPSASPSQSPSPSPTKEYKKADASKNEIPSNDEMQEIVKRTLLDFDDSLQKEDFTDFHASISKFWQKQTSPEKLKTSFQGFIEGEADLSPIRPMTAEFTKGPETTRSLGMKTLEVDGKYPTSPITTTFELKYIAEGKEWKLAGIQVITKVKKKP
jgi:hypothetical protein